MVVVETPPRVLRSAAYSRTYGAKCTCVSFPLFNRKRKNGSANNAGQMHRPARIGNPTTIRQNRLHDDDSILWWPNLEQPNTFYTLNTSSTSISASAFRMPAVSPASRGEGVDTETLSADVSPAGRRSRLTERTQWFSIQRKEPTSPSCYHKMYMPVFGVSPVALSWNYVRCWGIWRNISKLHRSWELAFRWR